MEKEEHKTALNNSLKHIKKRYILKKNNDIADLIKVKDSFLDPNQYLEKQKKMIIGNYPSKNNSNKIQPVQNLKSLSQSSTTKNNQQIQAKKIKKKARLIRNNSCINSYKTNNNYFNKYLNKLESTNDKNDSDIHYKIKSLGDMLKIFKKYKTIEEENKSKINSIVFDNKHISNEIFKEIGKNLSGQEKALHHQKEVKNYSTSFCKLVSKKINRNESDLLYNKIEEYRLKKQLMELKEKSKSVRDKFGDNYWVANLRRPKTSKEIRFVYSNTNNSNKSPDMIIDYADKDIEFISDPNLYNNAKYTEIIQDINIFRKIQKFKFGFPNVEKVAEMEMIKGKSLLEQEFHNFQEKKNDKFKLYKDPLEKKPKNMKEMLCKESFDVKYKIQRNHSFTNVDNIINNINVKKKKGLYRSKSELGSFQIKKNNNKIKGKENYLQKALKLHFKYNQPKQSPIKIISYK